MLEKKGWNASFSIDLLPAVDGYQGYLAFAQGSSDGANIVLLETKIDSSGEKSFGALTVLDLPNPQVDPSWSPTGLSIVYTSETPVTPNSTQTDVGVIDIGFDTDGLPVIIDGEFLAQDIGWFPSRYTWSPDGIHIGWENYAGARRSFEIVRIRADGSDNGSPTLVTDTRRIDELSPSWNPGWINDIDVP